MNEFKLLFRLVFIKVYVIFLEFLKFKYIGIVFFMCKLLKSIKILLVWIRIEIFVSYRGVFVLSL